MIVEEKIGDIKEAEEPVILFATNMEGFNDAGLASQMFRTFPQLTIDLPLGKPQPIGPIVVDAGEKQIVALCCHSLTQRWNYNATATAIKLLEGKELKGRIAIPRIGTGMVGLLSGARWDLIKKMFEESPLEFVLYSLK